MQIVEAVQISIRDVCFYKENQKKYYISIIINMSLMKSSVDC